MEKLFRLKAVEHQKNRLHGDVILLPRFSHSIILALIFVWFAFCILWLFSMHYARKETVVGWLEPPEGVIRVYADNSGVISKILVKDGDLVEKDQPIILITVDRYLASGDNLQLKIVHELNSQKDYLNNQVVRLHESNALRQKELDQQLKKVKEGLQLIQGQVKIQTEKQLIIQRQVDRHIALKQSGFVSSLEYDKAVEQNLVVKNDLQQLLLNENEQKNLINKLILEKALLPDEVKKSEEELRAKLSEIDQRIAEMDGSKSFVIKAPRSGIVNNLQALEGQQVFQRADAPIFTIFPFNSQLIVHLLLPVKAAGFVDVGQKLSIRYDAFPYQKFGIYHAEITQLSKTILLPKELLNSPFEIHEPVYQVTARLELASVNAYGKEFRLKPGMTLSADISLGDRTLIQWLLEPIFSLRGRL